MDGSWGGGCRYTYFLSGSPTPPTLGERESTQSAGTTALVRAAMQASLISKGDRLVCRPSTCLLQVQPSGLGEPRRESLAGSQGPPACAGLQRGDAGSSLFGKQFRSKPKQQKSSCRPGPSEACRSAAATQCSAHPQLLNLKQVRSTAVKGRQCQKTSQPSSSKNDQGANT